MKKIENNNTSQYNIVTLGNACITRYLLTNGDLIPSKALGRKTMVFDLMPNPTSIIVKSIQDNFEDYFEDFSPDYNRQFNQIYWHNKKYDVYYVHDRDCKNNFEKLKKRYQARIANFKEALNDPKFTYFIHIPKEYDENENKNLNFYVNNLYETIRNQRGEKPFKLVIWNIYDNLNTNINSEILVMNNFHPKKDTTGWWEKNYWEGENEEWRKKLIEDTKQEIIKNGFEIEIFDNKKAEKHFLDFILKNKQIVSLAQKIFKIENNHDINVKVLTFFGKKYILKKLYTPKNLNNEVFYENKEKTCAILNFWWTCNYGAILTAFALQKIIKHLGYNSQLINYKYGYKKKLFRNSIFEEFADKNLNISKKIRNYKEFEKYAREINTFIVGSDQVFNKHMIQNKLNEYLLGFTQTETKKVALSASFGTDKPELNAELKYRYKNYLKMFDYITVREPSGINICKQTFNCEASWLIDPVFILDKSIYIDLCKDANIDCTNKILTYVLDDNKQYHYKYCELSTSLHKEIFSINKNNVSVEDWINAINTCEFLITDSFHGMCFAIIFNKPFACIANKNRGAERFTALLDKLEISNTCLYNDITEINPSKIETYLINYETINNKLHEIKNDALKKLQKILIAPKKISNEALAAQINILKDKDFTKPVRNSKLIEYNQTETRHNLKIFGLKLSFKK